MTQVTNRRRPVIDTLLDKVVARDLVHKRATAEILDSIWFVKQGILKYLEIEDSYQVEFETVEIIDHDVIIQVTVPGDRKQVNLLEGKREAKLFTVSLPFEVLTACDADLVSGYIDDMTQFDTENLDTLELSEIEQLLDDCDTIKFEFVKRRILH
jgi:hypothetical protein